MNSNPESKYNVRRWRPIFRCILSHSQRTPFRRHNQFIESWTKRKKRAPPEIICTALESFHFRNAVTKVRELMAMEKASERVSEKEKSWIELNFIFTWKQIFFVRVGVFFLLAFARLFVTVISLVLPFGPCFTIFTRFRVLPTECSLLASHAFRKYYVQLGWIRSPR